MKAAYSTIRKAANCLGCPFVIFMAGNDESFCSKFAEGDPPIYPPTDEVTNCEIKSSEIVHQLKEHNTKLGLGFLITPLEGEEEGDCQVQLIGANGILFTGKLSELFENETYAAFPSIRIFDAAGVDRTQQVMKKALARAFDETPEAKHVFQGLLPDKSS